VELSSELVEWTVSGWCWRTKHSHLGSWGIAAFLLGGALSALSYLAFSFGAVTVATADVSSISVPPALRPLTPTTHGLGGRRRSLSEGARDLSSRGRAEEDANWVADWWVVVGMEGMEAGVAK
jgi:hypothetical protein